MEVAVHIIDLATMHPRLLWGEIAAASVAALSGKGIPPPFPFELEANDLPGFGSGLMRLSIDTMGVSEDQVSRLRRTYEEPRLVELAAIAIAGLGLYYGGGHEIRDVALRGSGADYLVDETHHLLEVAGRSRRSDVGAAW